jgi:hypothetical protein
MSKSTALWLALAVGLSVWACGGGDTGHDIRDRQPSHEAMCERACERWLECLGQESFDTYFAGQADCEAQCIAEQEAVHGYTCGEYCHDTTNCEDWVACLEACSGQDLD